MFKTRRSSGREIYRTIFILNDATEKKKKNVKDEFDIFKESTTPKNPEKRKKSTNF